MYNNRQEYKNIKIEQRHSVKCMFFSVCMKETLSVCMRVRDSISQMDELK